MQALRLALDNLKELFLSVGEAYERDFQAGEFERYEEPQIDLEKLRRDAEEGQRIRAEAKKEREAALQKARQ